MLIMVCWSSVRRDGRAIWAKSTRSGRPCKVRMDPQWQWYHRDGALRRCRNWSARQSRLVRSSPPGIESPFRSQAAKHIKLGGQEAVAQGRRHIWRGRRHEPPILRRRRLTQVAPVNRMMRQVVAMFGLASGLGPARGASGRRYQEVQKPAIQARAFDARELRRNESRGARSLSRARKALAQIPSMCFGRGGR